MSERLIDKGFLRAIAEGEPDTRLPSYLANAVPILVKQKWLMVCGHSDGDYVRVTKLGRAVLDGKEPPQ